MSPSARQKHRSPSFPVMDGAAATSVHTNTHVFTRRFGRRLRENAQKWNCWAEGHTQLTSYFSLLAERTQRLKEYKYSVKSKFPKKNNWRLMI